MILQASATLHLTENDIKNLNKLLRALRIYYRQALSLQINYFDANFDLLSDKELENEINKFKQYLKTDYKNLHPIYIKNAIKLAQKKFKEYITDNEKFVIKPLVFFKMVFGFEFNFKTNTLTLPDRKFKFTPSRKYDPNEEVKNIGLTIRKIEYRKGLTASLSSGWYKNEEISEINFQLS